MMQTLIIVDSAINEIVDFLILADLVLSDYFLYQKLKLYIVCVKVWEYSDEAVDESL